jgi:hypothetical protein
MGSKFGLTPLVEGWVRWRPVQLFPETYVLVFWAFNLSIIEYFVGS